MCKHRSMILKHSKIDLTIEQLHAKSFIHFIAELQNLLNYIGKHLQALHQTVSIAESVTAGFLQFSFSQMKDASEFFKGGLTVYSYDEKVNLLNIDREEVIRENGISHNIAKQMALNVAELYQTDWSIAVTGYSTPVKESDQKLFAYFSISYAGKILLTEKLDLHSRTMPLKAQMYYSEFILGCFKLELDKMTEIENERMSS